jgi:DNA-binding response OmpR family regulator
MSEKTRFEAVPIAEILAKGLEKAPTHRTVVLIVDDEPVIADTLAAILTHHGFAAMSAYDAETALELAAVIPPELLISDVMMPGRSGVDLAIAIKEAVPDCQVLLFSGQASTVDLLHSAREAGHDFTVLGKPVHPTELLTQIFNLGFIPSKGEI